MNLLNEIIEALSSQSGSLTDALLKTKVLLHKIGHQELVEWVNNELNGYSSNDNLPEYRILPAQVLVNASNMAYQITSHPIPLGHLTKEQRESLETARMHESLAVLEKLVEKPGGHLQAAIPMEANGLLGRGLSNGYIIQRAWCDIGQASVAQIFVQVRSRLLDFVLGLQDQLGDNVSEQEIKQKADSFDASSLFNNAIFGNNTTIVVGANNKQQVTNITVKGDFHTLAKELRQHGIKEPDISSLELAIKNDYEAPELIEKKFGPSVRVWLQGMLSKAVDSSWQIELGVASSLLATALQNFYGWP
ncbi:MAG: AbiTii domain-containing protein [Burkholderiales bacterium]